MEDLLDRLMKGHSGNRFDLGGKSLQLTSEWLAASGTAGTTKYISERSYVKPSTMLAELCRGGGTVANGTLHLGKHGVLFLHGTCDVEFSNVVITGAISNMDGFIRLNLLWHGACAD